MKDKEYKFKEGFTIKLRKVPDGIFFAMGKTHVSEVNVFDLYEGKKFIETYETFDEAKECGLRCTED